MINILSFSGGKESSWVYYYYKNNIDFLVNYYDYRNKIDISVLQKISYQINKPIYQLNNKDNEKRFKIKIKRK